VTLNSLFIINLLIHFINIFSTMRKQLLLLLITGLFTASVNAQQFSDYFTTRTCRVDLQFAGDYQGMHVYLDKIKDEPYWGGRQFNLTPSFIPGDFRFMVTDSASNKLIYADGFNTLFREWQTTDEARVVQKSFENTIVFPFPLATVIVTIDRRTGYDSWDHLFTCNIRPDDALIHRHKTPDVPVKVLSQPTDPARAVDIAIIAEGYSARELRKFFKEARKLADHLCSHEPFASYADRLNFYAVGAVSEESGISKPTVSKWKNTALTSHFHTFYSPRYLTTSNHFRLRDLASSVPYDAIYILANTDEYGGGGIYNFYAITAARGRNAREVTVHEFGHSFTGLADEYFYEHGDALDELYVLTEEPWEPNITTFVHFDKKWKNELPHNVEIPTPLPDDKVAQKSTSALGVYEGGGYRTKGVFRPTPDCRMKTNSADDFCPVCKNAVIERILFLTDDKKGISL
jgi:hypothetical protein